MAFIESPIYIFDLEFSNLDPLKQEILEIGVVRIDQKSMKETDSFESKISPAHIETSDPESLKVNGFTREEWEGAPPITKVLDSLSEFIKEEKATFSAWNGALDWTFLTMAYRKADKELPFDYLLFDIYPVAVEFLKNEHNISRNSLRTVSNYLGLDPEPFPHRALNGARQAAKVLKKIRELTG